MYFELVGEKDASLSSQLGNFTRALHHYFQPDLPIAQPKAFDTLTKFLAPYKTTQKIVLFFDELPWLTSKRSGLVQALDHFWNATWSLMPNVKLVVCGSSASWILDNLIQAKGGLHNRITRTIHLKPLPWRNQKLIWCPGASS